MASSAPNHNSLTARFVIAMRKKPNAKVITKRNNPTVMDVKAPERRVSEQDSWTIDASLGERRAIGSLDSMFSDVRTLVNRDRGSVDTEYMHSLSEDTFESNSGDHKTLWIPNNVYSVDDDLTSVDPRTFAARRNILASLSEELWLYIASFLNPAEAASLAYSNKLLRERLGSLEPWKALKRPENLQYKIEFLVHMDRSLPDHLLCFPCGTYHRRIRKGEERLQAEFVLNPLFNCPQVYNTVLPRARLTHGRELPFAFPQLALRAHRYSPEHGIQYRQLGRRWKCSDSDWSHNTHFHISKGHLLFRCVSMCYAPPDLTLSQQRLFLFSRTDYKPYFSVCAHWQDGELSNLCKCALSHIPKPPDPIRQQLSRRPKVSLDAARPNFIARLCEECRPMRRCPECPTEYVIDVRMVEDKRDRQNTFKHALVVTRWSDFGDMTSPTSPEWAACTGQAKYDSFAAIGRRSIAGLFESELNNTVPTQKILSLNPRKKSLGEEGNDWY